MIARFVVVDRVLDDDSAIVMLQGKAVIAEGTWDVTQRYELADGDVVVVPRVINAPIDHIRAAWPAIVGEAVAAASQPVAISGEALVIKTTSAAWSHQLSFLEREIIRDVRALCVAPVSRLRFRIGKAAA